MKTNGLIKINLLVWYGDTTLLIVCLSLMKVKQASNEAAPSVTPMKPKQIRVRRASKSRAPNKLVEKTFHLCEHADSIENFAKGPSAEVATTRTAVHLFGLVDDPSNDRQRRLSATLQVVRSCNSVYEVIWEDTADDTNLAAWSWG